MIFYRQCFNIPWIQKGFCRVLQQTNACDRTYNFTQPIVRQSSSQWVKMIREGNEEEARNQTSTNISSSGLKHKRSWQSGEKDGAPKRAKLGPDKDLDGGIKQEAEPGADKGVDTSLIICFDLELADGSFASEIFQVVGLHTLKRPITSYIVFFVNKIFEVIPHTLKPTHTIAPFSKDWGARRGERVQQLHPAKGSDRLGSDKVCEWDKGGW